MEGPNAHHYASDFKKQSTPSQTQVVLVYHGINFQNDCDNWIEVTVVFTVVTDDNYTIIYIIASEKVALLKDINNFCTVIIINLIMWQRHITLSRIYT